MTLRRQLLALSLMLLSLPWAGCEFLRETERTLRAGQAMAVNATAEAIAIALAADSALLYPAPSRRYTARSADWYVPAAEQPLIADGYDDDWRAQSAIGPLAGTPAGIRLHAATRGERLFLLLRIDDATARYFDPSAPRRDNGDRLDLLCADSRGRARSYRVATAAPGLVRARGNASEDLYGDRVRGTWRELSGGYQVELELPLGPDCRRLGLRYVDAATGGEALRLDTRSLFDGELPWLVYRVPALEARLAAYAVAGRHVSVRDRHGWIVAQLVPLDSEATGRAAAGQDVFWLLRWLYRTLLESGDATSRTTRQVTAEASIDDTAGVVRIGETTERYLALTDRSTGRVLGISAAVLGLALLGLLGYASLLSWRVRRLRDAARDISAERLPAAAFPRSRAADELGELSRSYADLLRQIDEYNRYLRGLARSLSHELRTPIAIIGSSLEHLQEDAANDPRRRAGYVERGRGGLRRLTRIVNAMSQVSRLEDSLASAECEAVDLRSLLQALCAAYADAWPAQRILCAPDHGAAEPVMIRGSGDLIAQALDKLVDNAVSFSTAGDPITLSLDTDARWAVLDVSNVGPPLPAALREHLFEPLVSLRHARDPESPHLGLGLHVARAIAEHHGGSLHGENLPNAAGVCFTLRLPVCADSGGNRR